MDNSHSDTHLLTVPQRELKVYKFKAPAFLKKLTNTYFKRTQLEDLHDLKKRIRQLKKKYKSKETNMSFNLEGYMWDKQKGMENNKERAGARQDTSNLHTDNAHHINGGGGHHLNERLEVGHISMISEDKLKQKGNQFVREYMPDKIKKLKNRNIGQVHIDLSS